MFVLADSIWKSIYRESPYPTSLQPEPGRACCVVEEGEGREGMAGEALFLEASETQIKNSLIL